ncbi:MAG: phosphoribosylformylglycinamidine synthase subunit PurQ [Planctomycetaceae bacterium]
MPTPRVCVLRAPGTNCDLETAWAFERCGAVAERVHLFRVLERPQCLAESQIVCVPGGFSYGDDVGAGVLFAHQIKERLADALAGFRQADKLLLGICNGFQVLLKAGLLVGSDGHGTAAPATLTWNTNGKYTALWVRLRVCSERNVFLRGLEEIELPIAHAEGRLVVADESSLADWQQAGQLALRYEMGEQDKAHGPRPVGSSELSSLPYPWNPNGSAGNVAGLGDATGRVLGLMPHPERYIDATQHPQWTRRGLRGDGAGLRVFRNAVEYFER